MKTIVLTVQNSGNNKYRLGINTSDSLSIFKCRGKKVHIFLEENCQVVCSTACGNPCDEDGEWLTLNSKTNLPYRKKVTI